MRARIAHEAGQGLADRQGENADHAQHRLPSWDQSPSKFSAVAIMLPAGRPRGESVVGPTSSPNVLPDYPSPGAERSVLRSCSIILGGVQSYIRDPRWMVEANTSNAYTTEQMIAQFKDLPSPSRPGDKMGPITTAAYVLCWSAPVIEKGHGTASPGYVNVDEADSPKPLGPPGPSAMDVLKCPTPHRLPGASLYRQGRHDSPEAQSPPHERPPACRPALLVGSVEDIWRNGTLMLSRPAKVVPPVLLRTDEHAGRNCPTVEREIWIRHGQCAQGAGAAKALAMRRPSSAFPPTASILPEDDVFVAVFTNSVFAEGPVPALVTLGSWRRWANRRLPTRPSRMWRSTPRPIVPVGPALYKVKDGDRRIFPQGRQADYTNAQVEASWRPSPPRNGKYFYERQA
jgi:hypothetical protein